MNDICDGRRPPKGVRHCGGCGNRIPVDEPCAVLPNGRTFCASCADEWDVSDLLRMFHIGTVTDLVSRLGGLLQ